MHDARNETDLPQVTVLMATFNGAPWLHEQVSSIAAQAGVRTRIVASDDRSHDATPLVLQELSASFPIETLPPAPYRFGNANRNFMRLIAEVDVGDADYFALSDQDDIWLPDKLSRAVALLSNGSCDTYSSDVIAFWPDGREKRVVKSHRQRSHDFLFESAGPGSTFVFPRHRFIELQRWVRDHRKAVDSLKVHDWVIYAYARSRGWRWVVDTHIGLRYRQHSSNEAGVNIGWRAAKRRLRAVISGAYVRDSVAIARAIQYEAPFVTRMSRLNWIDRLSLALHVYRFRRRIPEQLLLAAMFVFMRRGTGASPRSG